METYASTATPRKRAEFLRLLIAVRDRVVDVAAEMRARLADPAWRDEQDRLLLSAALGRRPSPQHIRAFGAVWWIDPLSSGDGLDALRDRVIARARRDFIRDLGTPVPKKSRTYTPDAVAATRSRPRLSALARLLRREARRAHVLAVSRHLTRPRERQCLKLVVRRAIERRPIVREEIAAELGITRSTVDGYIASIRKAAKAVAAASRGDAD